MKRCFVTMLLLAVAVISTKAYFTEVDRYDNLMRKTAELKRTILKRKVLDEIDALES